MRSLETTPVLGIGSCPICVPTKLPAAKQSRGLRPSTRLSEPAFSGLLDETQSGGKHKGHQSQLASVPTGIDSVRLEGSLDLPELGSNTLLPLLVRIGVNKASRPRQGRRPLHRWSLRACLLAPSLLSPLLDYVAGPTEMSVDSAYP